MQSPRGRWFPVAVRYGRIKNHGDELSNESVLGALNLQVTNFKKVLPERARTKVVALLSLEASTIQSVFVVNCSKVCPVEWPWQSIEHSRFMGVNVKTSTMILVSVVGGSLAFFVLQFCANQWPSSILAQSLNSLGVLYGSLLLTTGLFAAIISMNKSPSGSSQGNSKLRWAIGLPLLIGVVGVIQGYSSLMLLPADLPKDIPVPHGTVWCTAVVGAIFSIVAAMILYSRQHRKQDTTNFTT